MVSISISCLSWQIFKSEHIQIFENFQRKRRACLFATHVSWYAKVCTKNENSNDLLSALSIRYHDESGTRNAQISCHTIIIAFYSHRNLRLFITWKRDLWIHFDVCDYSNFRATISRVPYFHHNYHFFSFLLFNAVFIAVRVLGWCMHYFDITTRVCLLTDMA